LKGFNIFLNFTEIQEHIDTEYAKIGQVPEITLFPRWLAQTKIYNIDKTLNTSSYMIAGKQEMERKIGVAAGFPIDELKRGELITTKDVAQVLNADQGDTVTVDFDLF